LMSSSMGPKKLKRRTLFRRVKMGLKASSALDTSDNRIVHGMIRLGKAGSNLKALKSVALQSSLLQEAAFNLLKILEMHSLRKNIKFSTLRYYFRLYLTQVFEPKSKVKKCDCTKIQRGND